MKTINILTPFPSNEFTRQLPPDLKDDFVFYENGDLGREYDFVVVYEGVKEPISIKSKPGSLIFMAGEPPISRVYTKDFIRQFDYVISSHQSVGHTNSLMIQQSLPWHFGFDFQTREYRYTYEDLKRMQLPEKRKKLSIIASGKTMMPGHKKRKVFMDSLREKFPGEIDFFGKGIRPVNDKADAILPYYMTICIENSSIDNYWTEKIADAFLGFTIPLYYGCTNIESYFPADSFISLDIKKTKIAFEQIEYLLQHAESIYQSRISSVLEARTLLLDKYNIFPFLVSLIREHKIGVDDGMKEYTIIPNQLTSSYKNDMLRLRIKRYLQKWL